MDEISFRLSYLINNKILVKYGKTILMLKLGYY